MKVLIVSKALVSAQYRRKLSEIAALGLEVIAVVPPEWREGGVQRFEPAQDSSYRVIASTIRFNGRFHLHYYPGLHGILRREQPDLLHIDEEPYNLATYLATRSAARLGIPSVFFTWQNIFRRYPLPFRQMERYVYRASAAAMAGSAEAGRVVRSKGFVKPVSVIPQFGVDPTAFAPGEPPSGPFTIGFFNRLTAAKGPLLALEAMELLPEDTRLLMVGDGPLREQVERKIEVSGLGERVTLRHRVPSAEMPGLLRRVHVSILPSLATDSWKEQFGRVLIEAMATGVPVVGSASGEIPEVVGGAGLLVAEGDVAELAGALAKLYEGHTLRAELGARGRKRVLERYTHQRIAEQSVAMYRDVLAAAR